MGRTWGGPPPASRPRPPRTVPIPLFRRSRTRLIGVGIVTALLLAYVNPVRSYIDERADLQRQRTRLAALEQQGERYMRQIVSAEQPSVLEQRAREQGLVMPGERSFVIRGRLDPPPPPAPASSGTGGLRDWLPDIF